MGQRDRSGGATQGGSAASRADEAEVSSVSELLDRLEAAAEGHDPTSVGDVLAEVGDRSFGPILLLAGIVMVAPVVGDIPGVPVLMGVLVILVSGQVLARRDHFWIPGLLLRRSVSRSKVCTGVRWMRPVGRFLDRWSRPRMTVLTRGAGVFVAGVACTVIAAATPLMEVVPFSANVAGVAICAYGLALIARDGAIAMFAMVFSVGAFVLIARGLLS